MRPAIAVVALVVMTGCAGQQNFKSENAQLKAQVSALQTQVADLRAENAKLTTAAATPLTIDGLKLEPPKFGELRFTAPMIAARPYLGPTHIVSVDNTYYGATTIDERNLEVGKMSAGAGTIIINGDAAHQIGGTGSFHKTTAPAATRTTTTPATTPQK
jgi:hypothetical protein